MSQKSSIDPHELNKFNKTSEEWWDKNGEFKTLHDINPVRIKYITDKIIEYCHPTKRGHYHPELVSLALGSRSRKVLFPSPGIPNEVPDDVSGAESLRRFAPQNGCLANITILDIGCGGGLISVPLHKLGAKVTGLDANKHNIESALKYAKKNGLEIEFINSTVEEHKGKYDVVLCLEVIEHVANPEEFVQNLTRMLKDGGMIILSTINRTAKSYLQTIIIAEYILRWVPMGTHDHAKFIKPSELKNLLKNSKFQIKELKGLKLNPITNSWYLADDIDVNYFACIS